jgi:hypothetical protein
MFEISGKLFKTASETSFFLLVDTLPRFAHKSFEKRQEDDAFQNSSVQILQVVNQKEDS